MKKIFYISALILTLSLTACAPSEVDDIFDESPAARMDNAVKSYTELFQSNGGRWLMQYFANGSEQGYNYIMTFHNDGTVDISTKNSVVNGGNFATEKSLWEVVSDYGPVLSFNTNNSIFHVFSSPSSDGKGHEGDYEFVIISSEDNQVKLRGKKSALTIVMRRLSAEEAPTDEDYFTNRTAVLNATFNQRIQNYVLTTASGKRYICNGADEERPKDITTMIWSFYPEESSLLDAGEYMNAIFTSTGVCFMEPLDFLHEYDANDVAAQNFEIQPDGTLLCVEDGVTKIEGPALADLFHQKQLGWQIDKDGMAGEFLTLYNSFVNEAKKNPLKSTINGIQLTYDTQKFKYCFHFTYTKSGKSSVGRIYVNHEIIDESTIKFSFDPEAEGAFDVNTSGNPGNGNIFYNNLPSLRAFIDLLCTGEYSLSSSSLMVPNPIKMTSTSNPDNFVMLKFVTANV